MRLRSMNMLCLILASGALWLLGATREAISGEDATRDDSGLFAIHGGIARTTKEFKLEIAFHADGVGVYLYNKSGSPLAIESVKGTVRVEFKDPARQPLMAEFAVRTAETNEGPSPVRIASKGPLWASLDLSRIAEGEATARIKLSNLPGTEEKELALELPFRMARIVAFVCEKDGTSAAEPGLCGKCGRPLQLVLSYYGCKKHPEVASDELGQICWKCGEAKLEIMIERPPLSPRREEPEQPDGAHPPTGE